MSSFVGAGGWRGFVSVRYASFPDGLTYRRTNPTYPLLALHSQWSYGHSLAQLHCHSLDFDQPWRSQQLIVVHIDEADYEIFRAVIYTMLLRSAHCQLIMLWVWNMGSLQSHTMLTFTSLGYLFDCGLVSWCSPLYPFNFFFRLEYLWPLKYSNTHATLCSLD